MGEFDFFLMDDYPFQQVNSEDNKKSDKKRGFPKSLILILIVIVGGWLFINGKIDIHNYLPLNNDAHDNVNNNSEYENSKPVKTFPEKGYYTDQYIVKVELLDLVTINNDNYYLMKVVLKSNNLQNLNIISPTKEIVMYNIEQKRDTYKITVPVSRQLELNIPFKPLLSFYRKFIPIIIYSNDEQAYDFILVKTDAGKNNPLPPKVKSNIVLNVNPITHAELVQDNVILTKFSIYATNKEDYVYGVLVEITLSDDTLEFVKSGSNIILVPTLSPDYTLNLYIINKVGTFTTGERIKAVVTLKTGTGLITQKMTTIIIG